MTISTLISKYNKHVTVIKLKKTYAELQQVIKLSEVDNGDFRSWDYELSSIDFVEKYFVPYLNLKKREKSYYDKINLSGDKVRTNQISVRFYDYSDGKVFLPDNKNKDNKYFSFWVDIDGDNGENIIGKDIFYFTLFNYTYNTGGWVLTPICPDGKHYGLYLGGIGGYWGEYCGSLEGVLCADNVRGNCKKGGSGTACGLAIQKNNWKIPDNYPVKF